MNLTTFQNVCCLANYMMGSMVTILLRASMDTENLPATRKSAIFTSAFIMGDS